MNNQLSLQLYTLRDQLASNMDEALEVVASIGYSQVEPYDFCAATEELDRALRSRGLTAPTAHQSFIGHELRPILDAAATLGIGTVFDPAVHRSRWQTRGDILKIADQFNTAADEAATAGLRVGYHNHAWEFESQIADQSAFDVFIDALSPAVVIELDTYWVAVAGLNPASVVKELGRRVVAIHVKDASALGSEIDQVAVGSGILPIDAILDAAPALHVVELDDTRGDMVAVVRSSYQYLTNGRRA